LSGGRCARGAADAGGERNDLPFPAWWGDAAPRDDGVEPALDVLELNDLLSSLAQADPRAAAGVELRCFGGYTEPEIADIQGITERTVQRDWRRARAFLMAQLGSA